MRPDHGRRTYAAHRTPGRNHAFPASDCSYHRIGARHRCADRIARLCAGCRSCRGRSTRERSGDRRRPRSGKHHHRQRLSPVARIGAGLQGKRRHRRRCDHCRRYRRAGRPFGCRSAAACPGCQHLALRTARRSRPLLGRRLQRHHPRPALRSLDFERARHLLRQWRPHAVVQRRVSRTARPRRNLQERQRRHDRGEHLRSRKSRHAQAARQSGPQPRRYGRSQLRRSRRGMVARFLRPDFEHVRNRRGYVRPPVRLCAAGTGHAHRCLAADRSLLSRRHARRAVPARRQCRIWRLFRRSEFQRIELPAAGLGRRPQGRWRPHHGPDPRSQCLFRRRPVGKQ